MKNFRLACTIVRNELWQSIADRAVYMTLLGHSSAEVDDYLDLAFGILDVEEVQPQVFALV